MISIHTPRSGFNHIPGNEMYLHGNAMAACMKFLERVLSIQLIAKLNNTEAPLNDLEAIYPDLSAYRYTPFVAFLHKHQLSVQEQLVLFLALCPHLDGLLIDELIKKYFPEPGDYALLGGVRGKNARCFLPTGDTALFLLAGDDLHTRLTCHAFFAPDHVFAKQNILWLEEVPAGEPRMSGRLIMSSEYLELFTTGKVQFPKMGLDFPALHISTEMNWDDLVLNAQTMQEIYELQSWVEHHEVLMQDWDMQKKFKPGYRALFYGPPGTGKTLTATLLGKYTGREVFRIDLSMVVSKFIGETEKNLSQLFNRAENKNWILFFDEADALFSKRTNVRDAHDKYANQEAAYLLQRIETFDGLVILASNFKSNIDDAFIRRFQSVIHFPAPSPAERLLIWQKGIPSAATLADDVDLTLLAKKYELTGSGIMSVIHFSCLLAVAGNSTILSADMLLAGIRKEYQKEGKIW